MLDKNLLRKWHLIDRRYDGIYGFLVVINAKVAVIMILIINNNNNFVSSWSVRIFVRMPFYRIDIPDYIPQTKFGGYRFIGITLSILSVHLSIHLSAIVSWSASLVYISLWKKHWYVVLTSINDCLWPEGASRSFGHPSRGYHQWALLTVPVVFLDLPNDFQYCCDHCVNKVTKDSLLDINNYK